MLSIVMTVYNMEQFLDESIQSILNQSEQSFELICIDDGSTDNSLKILNKYKIDSRVRVYSIPNSGVSFARNYGLDLARGEYILFVDADDYVYSNLIQMVHDTIVQDSPDVVVFGYDYKANRYCPKYGHFSSEISEIQKLTKHLINNRLFSMVWNKVYSIKLLRHYHIAFPNQRIGEDSYFNAEVLSYTKTISTIGEVLYYYRDWNGSATHKKMDDNDLLNELYTAKKIDDLFYKVWGEETNFGINRALWFIYKYIKANHHYVRMIEVQKKTDYFLKRTEFKKMDDIKSKIRYIIIMIVAFLDRSDGS